MDKITLYDENNKAVDFEVLDMINISGREYLIVAPFDLEQDPFALRIKSSKDGKDEMEIVENDEELLEIEKYLEEKENGETLN